jgi:hypothetical protein
MIVVQVVASEKWGMVGDASIWESIKCTDVRYAVAICVWRFSTPVYGGDGSIHMIL